VAKHRRRLQELAEVGVSQFNLYPMTGGEDVTIDVYGREIVPDFTRQPSPSGA
jgi:hypothetical protein